LRKNLHHVDGLIRSDAQSVVFDGFLEQLEHILGNLTILIQREVCSGYVDEILHVVNLVVSEPLLDLLFAFVQEDGQLERVFVF